MLIEAGRLIVLLNEIGNVAHWRPALGVAAQRGKSNIGNTDWGLHIETKTLLCRYELAMPL